MEVYKGMKKVVKFGGSSLASAEQFKKVGAIIRQEESRRYVVPSAPGKRFSGDTKVTDMLYSCYHLAIQEEDFDEQLDASERLYGCNLKFFFTKRDADKLVKQATGYSDEVKERVQTLLHRQIDKYAYLIHTS